MARRRIQPLIDPGLRTILEDLRNRILNGRLPAGGRLPSVRELAATYGVAGTTVHRCLQELAAAGFLSTHGRNGTRVVEHPPHRCHFGLVLPQMPGPDGVYAERHWQAKALAARSISADPALHIEVFHGINEHPELPEHQRLLQSLEVRCLAGLIVVDEARIHDWLVPARLQVPVVGVAEVPGRPAIGNLRLELLSFLIRALDAVAKHALQRTAVLLNASEFYAVPALEAHAAALGLDLPRRNILPLPIDQPAWTPHVVASLFDRPKIQQPEALILSNENSITAVDAFFGGQGLKTFSRFTWPTCLCLRCPATPHFGWAGIIVNICCARHP